MNYKLLSAESGAQVLLVFLTWILGFELNHHVVSAEFTHGADYYISSVDNHLCLTSSPNDFRAEVGVYLGQVTLEECNARERKQHWGVILWSTVNGKNIYWFYPKENGLNELTAVLSEDGVYPVNNFFDVKELTPDRLSGERFAFKSLEFGQCVTSQGKSNPISFENCDVKRKDQQWKLKAVPDDPPSKSISGRSLVGLTIDFTRFFINKYFLEDPSPPDH